MAGTETEKRREKRQRNTPGTENEAGNETERNGVENGNGEQRQKQKQDMDGRETETKGGNKTEWG